MASLGQEPLAAHHGPRRDPSHTPTEAIEDYAKSIFALERRAGGPVGNSVVAERLGVSPASVTAMLKRMAELGLVEHEPYRGVTLTGAGRRVALEVIRHHRLIESYLADALGMPWDRVHAEAEVLEHYISEELEERMAEALGNPSVDPHGDPIPSAELALATEDAVPLSDLEPGDEGVFARVSDADPEMLRYLAERGIRPGARLSVSEREPFGDSLLIGVGGRPHSIGERLARRMLVRASA
jgi:DtxR family transcriptional regulator, Mn-dependent transcriptional regulator